MEHRALWLSSPWQTAIRAALAWMWCWTKLDPVKRRCVPREIARIIADMVRAAPIFVVDESAIVTTTGTRWVLRRELCHLGHEWKDAPRTRPSLGACAQCMLPVASLMKNWCPHHGYWTLHPGYCTAHATPATTTNHSYVHSLVYACGDCMRLQFPDLDEPGKLEALEAELLYPDNGSYELQKRMRCTSLRAYVRRTRQKRTE